MSVTHQIPPQEIKIDNIIVIDQNTTLGVEHIGQLLYVIASVTITWPDGGIANFRANLECNENGDATIIDEDTTPGNQLDAFNGDAIAANESCYLFQEPVNSKLRISK